MCHGIFHLIATSCISNELDQLDRKIYRIYKRPCVTQFFRTMDVFARDPEWKRKVALYLNNKKKIKDGIGSDFDHTPCIKGIYCYNHLDPETGENLIHDSIDININADSNRRFTFYVYDYVKIQLLEKQSNEVFLTK